MPGRGVFCRTSVLGGLAGVCLLLVQVSGHSYVTQHRWNTLPIHIYVDVAGYNGNWRSAAIEAMRAWNREAGQSIFSWTAGSWGRNCTDEYTTVTWENRVCVGGWGRDTLAQANIKTRGGRTVSADIYFNLGKEWNVYYGRYRTARNGRLLHDFRRVALHEFGHALGLGHQPGEGRVIMNAQASDVDRLQSDDINGARALYADYRGGVGGGGGTPDLEMSSVTLDDYSVGRGQEFRMRTTVENVGTGTASSTSIRYYYWSPRENEWYRINVLGNVVSLMPGYEQSRSQIFTTSSNTRVGTHYLQACAAEVRGERNGDNNCRWVKYRVYG